MSAEREILYIKGERNVEVTAEKVTLGEILALACSNKEILPKIEALQILEIPEGIYCRYVISILKIIDCIHEKYPEMEIQNLGETDIIITYENQKTPGKAARVIKTAIVMLLTFTGAAFSIMSFNNDVSITKLFSQIYEWMTGMKSDGFTILEVSYSLGIPVGILVFFNHFGKKKITVDPTPLEVQMRLYENDIQTTLVENASRKGEKIDVGAADPAGTHTGGHRV